MLPYTVGHDAGNFWLVSASNIILFANGSNALSRTIDGLRLPLLLSLDDFAWRLKPQKEFGLLVVGVRPSNLLRAKADNEELAPCTRQRPNSRVRTQTFGDIMHDDADVPQSTKPRIRREFQRGTKVLPRTTEGISITGRPSESSIHRERRGYARNGRSNLK